ncbi:MAG TPA: GTP-binding protein, partial [Methylosinus sp.]
DHHHSHGHGDVNRHDDHIRAFCVASETPLAPQAFDMFVEILRQAHGPNLLRVKGVVGLTDDPERPVVIHGVQHMFHPPHRLAAWPDGDRRTRLVFIVEDLDESFVARLYAAVAGLPAPDAPDAAALADNPLAPKNAGLLG